MERPFGRHKPRREGKMELRKVDWINLAQYTDIYIYIWRAVLKKVIPFVLYSV
jgi:hypothetical protein